MLYSSKHGEPLIRT